MGTQVQRLVSELVIELGGAQGDYGAGMASEVSVVMQTNTQSLTAQHLMFPCLHHWRTALFASLTCPTS